MKVRPFEQSDIQRVLEIFAEQGFEYPAPDWSKMTGQVLVDDEGVIRIALLDRPTVERYAVVDNSGWAAPGMKAVEFARLDRMATRDLKARGYEDEHCWVPPQRRAFARRLQKFFGWVKSDGPEGWLGLTRRVH